MQSSKEDSHHQDSSEKKSSEKVKKLSHSDESLDSDYRPTRYGSTDRDRKKEVDKDKNDMKGEKK